MGPYFYMVATVVSVMLLRWVRTLRRVPIEPPVRTTLLLGIATALVLDNFLRAVGFTLGEGLLLKSLGTAAAWLRAMVLPFYIVVFFEHLKRAEVRYFDHAAARAGGWILAFVLLGINLNLILGADFTMIEYERSLWYGLVDLTLLKPSMLIIYAAAALAGSLLATPTRRPWLIVGAGLGVASLLIAFPVYEPFVLSSGEILFLWAASLNERRIEQLGLAIGSGEMESRLGNIIESDILPEQ